MNIGIEQMLIFITYQYRPSSLTSLSNWLFSEYQLYDKTWSNHIVDDQSYTLTMHVSNDKKVGF